jgi:hypothetical protein
MGGLLKNVTSMWAKEGGHSGMVQGSFATVINEGCVEMDVIPWHYFVAEKNCA